MVKKQRNIVIGVVVLLVVLSLVLVTVLSGDDQTQEDSNDSEPGETQEIEDEVEVDDAQEDDEVEEDTDEEIDNDETDTGILDPEDVPEGMYQNPVFEPVFADPSIVRGDDGYFYAYGTEDDWGDGGGIRVAPVIKSANLVDWEFVGEAFEENPDWNEGWLWAPDVAKFNDKYYMYYTMSLWGDQNPGIGVATADHPAGPFEDHGVLTDTAEMGVYSIDPMLYVEDGVPYVFFGGITSGIFAIELAPDGLSTVGERIDIIKDGYEAPYIIEREGYYYLFGSNGSCCNGNSSTYNVGVGRSESLFGPYLNKNGKDMGRNNGQVILFGHIPFEENQGHIAGPGHNAIIQDDNGDDWIVYHGIPYDRPVLSSGATRRPLFIDKINWVDGWPEIENARPSITPQDAPYIEVE